MVSATSCTWMVILTMMVLSTSSLVLRNPFRSMTSSAYGTSPQRFSLPLPSSQRWIQQVKGERYQKSSTAVSMVRTRGLERNRQGATPTEGGMILYIKAGSDGTSVGDCPFAHFVRLVLEEKGLEYEVKPCTADTKPKWLIEHYEGKMPALRHRKECYTESGVIADYLEFFFPQPNLASPKTGETSSNENDVSVVLQGFFPTVAQYVKTPEGQDATQLQQLQIKLAALNKHFDISQKAFLEGPSMTLLDCKLIPQLYHLQTAINGFKQGIPNIQESYPQVAAYYERCASRPSFLATIYPEETVLWGWGSARK